jgi:acyl carrier protein
VLAEIQRILVTDLDARAPVLPEQRLLGDLHLDSMELIALAVGLENRFRVALTEADTAGVSTVADLAEAVSRRIATSRGTSRGGAP